VAPEEVGVLRLSKLGPGREGYYLQTVGIEPPGHWIGHGSEQAGLGSEVGRDELSALLGGRDPNSGEVLGTGRSRVRVTGFDMTFAAPKSVSLLCGIADEDVAGEVSSSHRAAVAAAVGYVENRALGVRRRHGEERTVEPVDGAYGAEFLHRTSRALDPHLHSHVVLANLGRGPDSRYSALDGRGIYAHAGAAGALYHAQLRVELQERLGVEWGPLDRGRADLVGISPEVRRGFSRRSAAIAADLGVSGRDGHRATEIASMRTRQPKDLTMGADELKEEWRKRASELGLGPVRLESVLGRVARSRSPGDRSNDLERDPEKVVVRLAEAGRPIARRHVVQAWCMELPRGAEVPTVERAADRLLDKLAGDAPSRGGLGRDGPVRDGPGVTERRLPLESLELGALAGRVAELAVERRRTILRASARGLTPGLEIGLSQDTGLGFG
jgi:conjugative relaxase-like TrwC/TraI family protein